MQHLGTISALGATVVAAGVIADRRFIGFDDKQAGLDALVKGISGMGAAIGDAIPATLVGCVDMIAGAAIAAAGPVASDANGQPIPKGANTNTAGFALAPAAIGARVRVLIR